jgi:hypothetical protein
MLHAKGNENIKSNFFENFNKIKIQKMGKEKSN